MIKKPSLALIFIYKNMCCRYKQIPFYQELNTLNIPIENTAFMGGLTITS